MTSLRSHELLWGLRSLVANLQLLYALTHRRYHVTGVRVLRIRLIVHVDVSFDGASEIAQPSVGLLERTLLALAVVRARVQSGATLCILLLLALLNLL